MRVYIDSGTFIDYLISRGHSAHYLRSVDRRGRPPQKLGEDAEECLGRIAKHHEGFTSALTFYEVEEALFRELDRVALPGVAHRRRFIIPPARAAVVQIQTTVALFNIQVLDLSYRIIDQQSRNVDFQIRGVRSADSLHVTMAMLNNIDIIVSSDDDILALDNVFQNASGGSIRCLDTDVALTQL